jgi:hypothetical protein
MNLDFSRLDALNIQPPTPEEIAESDRKACQLAEQNPTCFTHWHPQVVALGIPTPASRVIPFGLSLSKAIVDNAAFTESELTEFNNCIEQISDFSQQHGYPLFLKNSLYSGKHSWTATCEIASEETDIALHLGNITYEWLMRSPEVSLYFVVREMLDTTAVFHAFDGLPITEEFRFFSEDGRAIGHQPYWPEKAIISPTVDDWQVRLKSISTLSLGDHQQLSEWADQITNALTGAWSVDFLRDSAGNWWLIDMAEANKSFRCQDGFIKATSTADNA